MSCILPVQIFIRSLPVTIPELKLATGNHFRLIYRLKDWSNITYNVIIVPDLTRWHNNDRVLGFHLAKRYPSDWRCHCPLFKQYCRHCHTVHTLFNRPFFLQLMFLQGFQSSRYLRKPCMLRLQPPESICKCNTSILKKCVFYRISLNLLAAISRHSPFLPPPTPFFLSTSCPH